jgi:hypothetical protein
MVGTLWSQRSIWHMLDMVLCIIDRNRGQAESKVWLVKEGFEIISDLARDRQIRFRLVVRRRYSRQSESICNYYNPCSTCNPQAQRSLS